MDAVLDESLWQRAVKAVFPWLYLLVLLLGEVRSIPWATAPCRAVPVNASARQGKQGMISFRSAADVVDLLGGER